jgi:hypothetical protein
MILPVSLQQQANLKYFRTFSDQELLIRLKDIEFIWFRLLMSSNLEDIPTITFWQQSLDDMEFIAKERNLIKSDPKNVYRR